MPLIWYTHQKTPCFFFWLGLTDQRSWKPKGSKSSAICRCLSGPLAEENLGISSHHGFHILVTLMMVLVNGTIGVTIYTVRGTQMVWWLGLDDSGSPMESPMKIIPLNKWHLSFGRFLFRVSLWNQVKIAFQHPICVVFPYFVASLMFVLLTLFAFSVVCVPPFVIRCASADSIAEKTLQDKETRKEALRKVWFDACRVEHFCWFVLVGGLEHSWIMTFHILRMSSSIFFRGVGIPPTSVCIDHHFIQTCMYIHNIT